jgi:hypothetical protein
MTDTLIGALLNSTLKQNTNPFATLSNGTTLTYIIYGVIPVGKISGYEVKRITDATNSTVIETGFLPESLRLTGANGSGADVNLKTDLANSLLLLADTSISYS